jgi:hypothetical protein
VLLLLQAACWKVAERVAGADEGLLLLLLFPASSSSPATSSLSAATSADKLPLSSELTLLLAHLPAAAVPDAE